MTDLKRAEAKYYEITLKVESWDYKGKSYLNDARAWIRKTFTIPMFCSTLEREIHEVCGNYMLTGKIKKINPKEGKKET